MNMAMRKSKFTELISEASKKLKYLVKYVKKDPKDNDELDICNQNMKYVELSTKSYYGLNRINTYPLVSIVMPIYNSNKNYLEKSIFSCLNQTYRNIELIIVEDGSENDSEDFIKSIQDKRIKYIKKDKNEKIPAALNTGFKASKGEYLTWTSDDNFYMEEAIEVMLKFLINNPEYDFVYSDYYWIDGYGNVRGVQVNPPPDCLSKSNTVGPCFLYTRKVYETIGDYSDKYFTAEDYEYWIRVSKKFKMYPLKKVLYFYRRHEKRITFRHRDLVEKTKEQVLQRHFKLKTEKPQDKNLHNTQK